MSIKFTVVKTGDVTILNAKGSITLGERSTALRNIIREQLKGEAKKIVLNLEEVLYIDGSSIGELASSRNKALRMDGEIKLAAPNKKVIDLLTITKNNVLFDIHTDVDAAIRCFGGEHIGCGQQS